MEQLFISVSGASRERWLSAFPRAAVVAGVAAVSPQLLAQSKVLWLDISGLSPAARDSSLQAAAALGRPLVAMTATPTEAEGMALLRRGATGYCHCEAAPEQLREIALVVEHGGIWMPPELMQRFLALSARVVPVEAPAEPQLNELTARELMVAEQVAHGASNREIAQTLGITERTVKAHLSVIFEKLAVRDRVQLALAMNHIPTYTSIN